MASRITAVCHAAVRPAKYLVLCTSLLTAVVLPDSAGAEQRALFTSVAASLAKRAPRLARAIKHVERRVTTGSADLVHIDVNLLRRCSTRAFGPNERTLTFRDGRLDCGSHHVRLGILSGTGEGSFVIRQGKVTGAVSRGDATFRIEPVPGGRHALVKVDTTRFPAEDAEPHEHKTVHRKGIPRLPQGGAGQASHPIEIDVLVAYTPAVAAATDDIAGLIDQAILDANASYRNSDINIRLKLVDSFQLRYAEGLKTFQQLVNDFAKSSTVNARRDRAGADVSVLIVDAPGFCRPADMTSEPQPGGLNCCGLGDALMATADTAFSVVHQQCVLAPNYSFTHEIGHLQGATHDKDGVLPAFQPHGHGFQHTSGRTRWRTIMAYDCKPSCPRLPYWSNPRIKLDGVPMGTPEVNDNARVLNETAATIAAFRNRPTAR